MNGTSGGPMVRTAATSEQAARRYDFLSSFYGFNTVLGSSSSRRALKIADLREGESALELGVGTGRDLVRLARSAGPTGRVYGLDLAPGMLAQARRRIHSSGHAGRVILCCNDARSIPIADQTIDVVFSSRLLDLTDTPDIPRIIAEAQRVLRPSGRLVLVHMSKAAEAPTLFERLYVGAMGGRLFLSRPVLVAPLLEKMGFERVTRSYRREFPVGSEIVSGRRRLASEGG